RPGVAKDQTWSARAASLGPAAVWIALAKEACLVPAPNHRQQPRSVSEALLSCTRWRAVAKTRPAFAETSSFASDVLPERGGRACESIGVPGSRQEIVVNGTNSLHSCGETELGFD